MDKNIKTILVDLTPVLPGGENGGAKVFVLELLKHLADNHPNTNFLLLTQSKAHDELSSIDKPNISRIMIEQANGRKSFLARCIGFALCKIPYIPRRISLIGYRLFASLRKRVLKKFLENIKPDLVFCPFTAPTYAISGVPTVCVVYDLQYKTHPLFFDKADMLNRDHAFMEACRVATKLTAISEYSRQSALTHGKLASDKIKTIHLRMAKRNEQHESTINDILKTYELEPKKFLLYPANFWPHKNHEMLLTALKIAYHKDYIAKDIKLVCTGAPGKRQQWLIDSAEKMGLKSAVKFTGYLKNAELATLLSNSAGVIFPSLYEGFGLPILEAMAVNVPVACSKITSLPEIAAGAAVYFDPRKPEEIAEAMQTLVSDNELCKKLIKIGQERVQTFCDSSKMAKEYWELFQNACFAKHELG